MFNCFLLNKYEMDLVDRSHNITSGGSKKSILGAQPYVAKAPERPLMERWRCYI